MIVLMEKGQFGLRLAELRRARGLTQEELAKLADLSQAYVSDLEQGHRRHTPSVDVAHRLAKALKCSIESLLEPAAKGTKRAKRGRPKESEQ